MASTSAPHTLNYSFNQTMIRVKDPTKSVPFYTKWFGMALIQRRDFTDFSLYFLATLPPGHVAPDPTSEEAAAYLHGGTYGCCLELTHNHGTEGNADFAYHNGNSEPRGFGHIGFLVDDLHTMCADMEAAGIAFKKKPNEGSMKNLAFALDPDGYWVEMIPRAASAAFKGHPSFQQTMLRVKATLSPAEKAQLPLPGSLEATDFLWGFTGTTLELTHNYGTESDPEFKGYSSGNVEPHRGFGHIAFMVDDVRAACAALEAEHVKFQKKPDEGRMKGIAFALDPDGYWVEIVPRQPHHRGVAK